MVVPVPHALPDAVPEAAEDGEEVREFEPIVEGVAVTVPVGDAVSVGV